MLARDEWLGLARKLDWEYSYVQEAEVFPEVDQWPAVATPCRVAALGRALQDLLPRIRETPARERRLVVLRCARRSGGWRMFRQLAAALDQRLEVACRGPAARRVCRGDREPESRPALDATAPGGPWRPSAPWTSSATRKSRCCSCTNWCAGMPSSTGRTSSFTPTTGSLSPPGTSLMSSSGLPMPSSSPSPPTLSSRPVHQSSVRRPVGLARAGGRPHVRDDGQQHPDRRSPARPDRSPRARHRHAARSGVCAVPAGQMVLAQLAAVCYPDRFLHGLSDPAGATPLCSFKEFMEEWIIDQFLRTLDEFGLKKPWYWDYFPGRAGDLPSHGLRQCLYLSRHALVQFGGAQPGGADLAAPEVSEVLGPVEPVWEQIRRALADSGPGHRVDARTGRQW